MKRDMMTQPIDPILAEIALTRAAGARVLHRHRLDFCCGGQQTLRTACAERGLDADAILAEIDREEQLGQAASSDNKRWDEAPLPELIEHLLAAFHAKHRADLPPLIEMAEKVERVHSDKPECPRGLAAHLRAMEASLEDHMQKEEQILFPMILAGHGNQAGAPVMVMEEEHRDHARNLERLRALTTDYVAPEVACTTWRALYENLLALEHELMLHISLENNVLFPGALRD